MVTGSPPRFNTLTRFLVALTRGRPVPVVGYRGANERSPMSTFTPAEIDYLNSQRLARLATVGPDGQPHLVPLTFVFNASEDAIDVGGVGFGATKKWRDARRNPRVTFLLDDVLRDPRRARALGVGLLSGGYGQQELEQAGAVDTLDKLKSAGDFGRFTGRELLGTRYTIDTVLSYAPHAAWVRASSGATADALGHDHLPNHVLELEDVGAGQDPSDGRLFRPGRVGDDADLVILSACDTASGAGLQ